MKTPIKVGTDTKRLQVAVEAHQQLAKNLTRLFEVSHTIFPVFSIKDLFELSRKPLGDVVDDWCAKHFIRTQPEKFGQFDPGAAIRAGLVKFPDFHPIKEAHSHVFSTLRNAMGEYYTGPRLQILRMFNNEKFELTPEIWQELENFYSFWATTEKEISLYNALQRLVACLENVSDHGIKLKGDFSLQQIGNLTELIQIVNDRFMVRPDAIYKILPESKIFPEKGNIALMFQI